MKILLISDSHGHSDYINQLVNSNNYDHIFFAGDGIRDLGVDIYNPKVAYVRGNCDFYAWDAPITQTLFIEEHKILITHGDYFYVKSGLENLHAFAKQKGYNLICFGHTHLQTSIEKDGIQYINAGALKNGDYAEIMLDKNTISCTLKNITTEGKEC